MRFLSATPGVILLLLAGCQQQNPEYVQTQKIRTIENQPIPTIPLEELPVIREESMELKPTQLVDDKTKKKGFRPETATKDADLQEKMELPFAPLIAMDPVDGSKVSIRVETPTTEYKNRLYYFSTEENRRVFSAEPDKFLTGQLARY